ncbi:MAG: YqgE/AlgH family protein [Verrucomicrobiia bacterium]|jgi:putative transcriptional regulator
MSDQFKSLKGQLLLDSGKLRGSCFHRAVVLVCQHDENGAFGLIINHPGPTNLGDAIVADLPAGLDEEILFLGGPVQASALSYLQGDTFIPDANVIPGLNLEHSLDDLIEAGASFSPTQKVKIFSGYSGWAPGQLDDEMARGAWLLHPATIEQVFCDDPEELWQVILKGKGWEYRLLSDAPDDISYN